ncbi:hypothetical protein [Brevundimonas diminuta]|uniref:hypothetical protein n=1 Tax=Brevundimonas diminuta TaxID=293 RepID=UPI0028A90C79|nr:hypothetical protein [Brevundimonas diminuta]
MDVGKIDKKKAIRSLSEGTALILLVSITLIYIIINAVMSETIFSFFFFTASTITIVAIAFALKNGLALFLSIKRNNIFIVENDTVYQLAKFHKHYDNVLAINVEKHNSGESIISLKLSDGSEKTIRTMYLNKKEEGEIWKSRENTLLTAPLNDASS